MTEIIYAPQQKYITDFDARCYRNVEPVTVCCQKFLTLLDSCVMIGVILLRYTGGYNYNHFYSDCALRANIAPRDHPHPSLPPSRGKELMVF